MSSNQTYENIESKLITQIEGLQIAINKINMNIFCMQTDVYKQNLGRNVFNSRVADLEKGKLHMQTTIAFLEDMLNQVIIRKRVI